MAPCATALRHSLSARLFRLTIVIVLAVEVLVFVPQLTHERLAWLQERMDDARIAALAASSDPDHAVAPTTAAELLRLSGTNWIRMAEPGHLPVTLGGPAPVIPDQTIVMRNEGWVMRTIHALRALADDRHEETRLLATLDTPPGTHIELVFRTHRETDALRQFAGDFVWVSLLTACLTGITVYAAVWLLMVRPMRRIIASITAFRLAPEHSRPLEPPRAGKHANDEMTVAARELSALQGELRNALWRNARLSALGSAVARISHDLRGVLAPVLLTAERLQAHPDASVQRAADMLMRTADRATDLVRRTLDFAREGPPPLQLAPVALGLLVDEASTAARAPGRAFAVHNQVPPGLLVEADRNQFFRVLANLLRNAADAGARLARVSASAEQGSVTIDVADDGPGLPDSVRATLFHPFTRSTRHEGTGLGLAIARDLTLAHGGEIALASSGPEGTVFRLTLRIARLADEPDRHTGKAKGTSAAEHDIAPAAKADV
ncbi:MAG TPA: HAMP domain-containing sensor histidine kinase [Acetobacteraceae bacterium]|nr:HAMP domain-containing sensor histidine kinase [Acetobacteraceae bacterium]